MTDMLVLGYSKNELAAIKKFSYQIAAKFSDDEWSLHLFLDDIRFNEYLKKGQMVDLGCFDINHSHGTAMVEKFRESDKNATVMLIAEPDISPMEYLKPSIMATTLLLRPFTPEQLYKTLKDIIKMRSQNKTTDDENSFSFMLNSGRKFIPYEQIYYFEARDKKIYVNTGSREYAFYDTIENLQNLLPQSFVRCHRSFMVSKAKIDRIYLSKGYLELDNGMTVPVSRSYKAEIVGGLHLKMPDSIAEPPYEGAKPMLTVTILDDREKLQKMVCEMYPDLPERKPRKKK